MTSTSPAKNRASNDLIYGLNDRPALKETIFAALQHLLAIFVAIITPPLIISNALGFDVHTTGFLVSMSLFVSGIATFIQCHRIGPIGTGLLCIQGTSFSFIGPIIGAGMLGMVNGKLNVEMALSYIFTACMFASIVEMIVSRILPYTRKIITPLVSGIVVTLIGMSLIKAGINSCGGGAEAQADGTFGSLTNLGLAALVLVLIVIFNRSGNRFLRMSSIVLGLLAGCVVAYFIGMIDFKSVTDYGGFYIPTPFKYGLHFDISAFIGLGLVYLITAIEAYGDVTANSLISGEPIEGPVFMKRASGGILADGFNSFLAAVFNSFPNSIFAQNNGADRHRQPLRRLLHRRRTAPARYLPRRRPGVLADARSRPRRSHTADVRHRSRRRHPYHRIDKDQPEGRTCHGHQLRPRTQRRDGARHPRTDARDREKYLLKRHHHRRTRRHHLQRAHNDQGVSFIHTLP